MTFRTPQFQITLVAVLLGVPTLGQAQQIDLDALGEEAVLALVETLGTDASRASMATYALGKMSRSVRYSHSRTARAALLALTKALESGDADTRSHAAWALGRTGSTAKAALPLLKDLLKDDDKNVRYNASTALDSIREDQ